jgi:hypothetical protein
MPQEPFRRLIEQIANLLDKAEKNASKPLEGEVDPDSVARLNRAAKAVAALKARAAIVFQGNENAEKKMEEWMKNPEGRSWAKKTFEDLLGLGLQALGMKKGLSKACEKKGISKEQQKGEGKQKAIQRRKSKFKKMGGDKWKRM